MFWGGFVFCFCCNGLGSVGCGGGGWFWGAEGLGLKGWGFGGFSRMPVVVVRGPVVFVVVVPQRGGGPVVAVLLW